MERDYKKQVHSWILSIGHEELENILTDCNKIECDKLRAMYTEWQFRDGYFFDESVDIPGIPSLDEFTNSITTPSNNSNSSSSASSQSTLSSTTSTTSTTTTTSTTPKKKNSKTKDNASQEDNNILKKFKIEFRLSNDKSIYHFENLQPFLPERQVEEEKRIVKIIRLCDTKTRLDTFTIDSNSITNTELVQLLTKISQGGFLQVPCHLIKDGSLKDWRCEPPSWFISKSFFSLGEFIASWFERLIWTRFWEDHKIDGRKDQSNKQLPTKPLFKLLDSRKQNLKEFWSKMTVENRKRIALSKMGNILAGEIQSLNEKPEKVDLDFMEKFGNLVEDFGKLKLKDTATTATPTTTSKPPIKAEIPTPTTKLSSSVTKLRIPIHSQDMNKHRVHSSTSSSLSESPENLNNISTVFEEYLVQNPVKLIEFLCFSPLERAGSTVDMVMRQMGHQLQHIYSESLFMDLIHSEERQIKKGKSSSSLSISSSSTISSDGGSGSSSVVKKKKKKSTSNSTPTGSGGQQSSSTTNTNANTTTSSTTNVDSMEKKSTNNNNNNNNNNNQSSLRKKRKKKPAAKQRNSGKSIDDKGGSDTESEVIQTRPRRHSLPMDIAPTIKTQTGIPYLSTTEDEDGVVLSEGELEDYPPKDGGNSDNKKNNSSSTTTATTNNNIQSNSINKSNSTSHRILPRVGVNNGNSNNNSNNNSISSSPKKLNISNSAPPTTMNTPTKSMGRPRAISTSGDSSSVNPKPIFGGWEDPDDYADDDHGANDNDSDDENSDDDDDEQDIVKKENTNISPRPNITTTPVITTSTSTPTPVPAPINPTSTPTPTNTSISTSTTTSTTKNTPANNTIQSQIKDHHSQSRLPFNFFTSVESQKSTATTPKSPSKSNSSNNNVNNSNVNSKRLFFENQSSTNNIKSNSNNNNNNNSSNSSNANSSNNNNNNRSLKTTKSTGNLTSVFVAESENHQEQQQQQQINQTQQANQIQPQVQNQPTIQTSQQQSSQPNITTFKKSIMIKSNSTSSLPTPHQQQIKKQENEDKYKDWRHNKFFNQIQIFKQLNPFSPLQAYLQPWDEPPLPYPHPTFSIKLHQEILDFVSEVGERTYPHVQNCHIVINLIKSVVKKLWPNADLDIYGSFMTGLWLPSSDIDIVVNYGKNMSIKPKNAQFLLKVLEKQIRTDLNNSILTMLCIPSAKIPVIKLVTKENIAVDISFRESPTSVHTGIAARDLVAENVKEVMGLYPLAIVLKWFLRERGLNNTYTGGLSSYCLVLMLISFLKNNEHCPKIKNNNNNNINGNHNNNSNNNSSSNTTNSSSTVNTQPTLKATPCNCQNSDQISGFNIGCALMRFLEYYGVNFNYQMTGISIEENTFTFPLTKDDPVGNLFLINPLGNLENNINNNSNDATTNNNLDNNNNQTPPTTVWYNHSPFSLVVEDPFVKGKNVAAGAFNFGRVKAAFQYAFATLSNTSMNELSFEKESILSKILMPSNSLK
ncbi:hypothetical protein CYY_005979 [Polysphondylium violaceum]|uniref:Uncharacterized protein n=1 Tax=Polysphondylium violaceum TaxID=133409 RepID=A0A8J4PUE4_9MYCE|nr:hypothetical protein CYY_005979 [Polysphondylium violaceum]